MINNQCRKWKKYQIKEFIKKTKWFNQIRFKNKMPKTIQTFINLLLNQKWLNEK